MLCLNATSSPSAIKKSWLRDRRTRPTGDLRCGGAKHFAVVQNCRICTCSISLRLLQEDDLLKRLVLQYGPKYWNNLAEHLPGRHGKQLRER